MKVSVIIPCYNVENYIERCITSIIPLKEMDYEILAINDGSTDNTLNLLNTLASKYSQLNVITIENSGVSYARNIGIEQAKGEYILFVDADDWLKKNSLIDLYEVCLSESLDVLMFNYSESYNNSEIKACTLFKDSKKITSIDAVRELLINNNTAAIWNKVIKREILINNEINFNSEIKIGEDLLYSIEVLLNSKKIKYISNSYYFYYIRDDSATHAVSDKVLTVEEAVKNIYHLLHKKNVLNQLQREFEYMQFIHLFYYRVIVGPIQQPYHRYFYENFALKNIHSNQYYKMLIGSHSFSIRLRILLYSHLPYKMAYNIHRIMRNLSH